MSDRGRACERLRDGWARKDAGDGHDDFVLGETRCVRCPAGGRDRVVSSRFGIVGGRDRIVSSRFRIVSRRGRRGSPLAVVAEGYVSQCRKREGTSSELIDEDPAFKQ